MPVVLAMRSFLSLPERAALLAFTLCHEAVFVSSSVQHSDGAESVSAAHRRSRVLYDLADFEQLFRKRLLALLPTLRSALDLRLNWPLELDIQLTASNDGEYFRTHTDAFGGGDHERYITFVYFFHREPKAFRGGELRLYDSVLGTDGNPLAVGPWRSLQPRQGYIVFFASHVLHEVLPVICPSLAFSDSRFTVTVGFTRKRPRVPWTGIMAMAKVPVALRQESEQVDCRI